jgi:anti-sigma-K factor RskA
VNDRDERHLLSGAYSLDAVNDQERADLESYIAGSEDAAAEVASLSETAVRLGLATEPAAPSPQLRASLMAAVRSTPQLAADRDAADSDAVGPDAFQQVVAVPATAEPARMTPDRLTTKSERAAQSRWFARPATILIAAVAAVALFAGGTAIGLAVNSNQKAQQTQQAELAQSTSLAELSTAKDVQRAVTSMHGGVQATLIWSLQLRRSAVLIDDLPSLRAGKTYQLWYMDAAGAAKPAGTFESQPGGKTWRVLDGTMSGGDTVGVTVEPDGGSAQPTSTPIVTIATS